MEIRDLKLDLARQKVQSSFSDFECEMQDSSKLKFLFSGKLLLVTTLFLTSCGKVGDPLPPFIRIPEAVKDLGVTQSGYSLVLTWTNPPRNIDGSTATNLARVQIKSNDTIVATMDVTGPGQPQSYVIPVNASASGDRRFTLLVYTSQGKVSNVSNAASIAPTQVPGRVVNARGFADQRRIIVEWDKPQERPDLADAYAIARVDPPGPPELLSETRYEDTYYEPSKIFRYQITALRRIGGNTVPGLGPETVTVMTDDKTPPQAPTDLEISEVGNGGYLTWTANSETDFAGYRVFRSEHSDRDFKPLSDHLITTNAFLDMSYRPGLYYRVSAVDEFNNESAPSAPFRAP